MESKENITKAIAAAEALQSALQDLNRSAIKAAMDEMGLQVGGLFVLLYEREPIGSEVQTLRNRLNRGNPGADFLGLCVSKMPPLQQRLMAEFFGLTAPEQTPS